MNEKIDLEKLMLSFQNELTKTNDIKQALENILIQNVEDIEKFVDIEKTVSELLKSIEPLSTI